MRSNQITGTVAAGTYAGWIEKAIANIINEHM